MSFDIRIDQNCRMFSGVPAPLLLESEEADVQAQQVKLDFSFPERADLRALRHAWLEADVLCRVETDTYIIEGLLMNWNEGLVANNGCCRMTVIIQGTLTMKLSQVLR